MLNRSRAIKRVTKRERYQFQSHTLHTTDEFQLLEEVRWLGIDRAVGCDSLSLASRGKLVGDDRQAHTR